MPSIRIGFGSDFSVSGANVGIGTTIANAKLQVSGAAKADFNITGVATFTSYNGFVAQKQNINKASTIGFGTVGVGTFQQYYETETGFTDLGGVHHGDDQYYNTLSQDLVIDDGQILNITSIDMVGVTTIGEYDPHSHQSHVCLGALEELSVIDHFSVPCGGSNDRQSFIEGTIRFNDDLNTLEFFNGNEWRQFTYNQGQSGRMVIGGGTDGSASNVIQYLNINTFGNSQNFGDLTLARSNIASCSSSIRGIWAGGADGSYSDIIEYVTIASAGNSIDFGNLSTANRAYMGGTSSSTRGIFGGGYQASPLAASTVDIIDYIEIGTLGNALDFGNLFTGRYSPGAVSNGVRAVWGGGNTPNKSVIDFVNIAAKGNAVFFGDLTAARRNCAGGSFSNNVRGCFSGGQTPVFLNVIDYITIASEGNAIDFGSLSTIRARPASGSTNTRGVMAGGINPSVLNSIEYVNITSTGDAQDFGDLSHAMGVGDACSDSHGGLGGF